VPPIRGADECAGLEVEAVDGGTLGAFDKRRLLLEPEPLANLADEVPGAGAERDLALDSGAKVRGHGGVVLEHLVSVRAHDKLRVAIQVAVTAQEFDGALGDLVHDARQIRVTGTGERVEARRDALCRRRPVNALETGTSTPTVDTAHVAAHGQQGA